MDFTIAGSVLAALLLAIPAIGAYFQRANRLQRREIRKLRSLVQEFDVHVYFLERNGWTSRGVRPPPRPELLRALAAHDDTDDEPDAPAPRPDDEAGRRSRHAAP